MLPATIAADISDAIIALIAIIDAAFACFFHCFMMPSSSLISPATFSSSDAADIFFDIFELPADADGAHISPALSRLHFDAFHTLCHCLRH